MVSTEMVVTFASAGMMVVGVAFGLIAYRAFARTRAQVADSYRTTGEVIDVQEHPGGEYGPLRHPVVKFTAENGEAVVFESAFGMEQWNVSKGDRLNILVNRHDAKDAQVYRFAVQWGKPMVLAIIASSIIQGAVLLFFIFREK